MQSPPGPRTVRVEAVGVESGDVHVSDPTTGLTIKVGVFRTMGLRLKLSKTYTLVWNVKCLVETISLETEKQMSSCLSTSAGQFHRVLSSI